MRAPTEGLPRCVDIAVASLALVVTMPVLALAATAIALTSPGPVFFRHERVGRGGRRFMMLKFRTMHTGRTGPDVTTRTDARITRVGRLLRHSKLDEVPELWNIVRGDMALVGPRPESPKYVDLTDAHWQEVLSVRPGVTDRTTLRLRNEEDLLATAGLEPEPFYLMHLLPYKLHGYRDYLAVRSWKTDLAVLWQTAVAIVFPASAPPPGLEEILSGRPTRAELAPRLAAQLTTSFADTTVPPVMREWFRRIRARG